ncbi:MAG: DUF4430 domain-containing protein [Syntrophomonas sp.]|nr:DUF4430 domain-containing protein [Syntrophomonas sp.]
MKLYSLENQVDIMKRIFTIGLILLLTMVATSCSQKSDSAGQNSPAGALTISENQAAEPTSTGDRQAGNIKTPEPQAQADSDRLVQNPSLQASTPDNSAAQVSGGSQAAPSPQERVKTVSISIKKQEGSYILDKTPVSIQEGDSVLSVLIRAGKDHGIPVVFSGSKKAAYIEGINNVFEFDQGPESGWIYKVNGVQATQSSGAYLVTANDEITWVYVTSLQGGLK